MGRPLKFPIALRHTIADIAISDRTSTAPGIVKLLKEAGLPIPSLRYVEVIMQKGRHNQAAVNIPDGWVKVRVYQPLFVKQTNMYQPASLLWATTTIAMPAVPAPGTYFYEAGPTANRIAVVAWDTIEQQVLAFLLPSETEPPFGPMDFSDWFDEGSAFHWIPDAYVPDLTGIAELQTVVDNQMAWISQRYSVTLDP